MVELGQVAYEAYARHAEWRSLRTGEPLQQWEDLPLDIQDAWKASAFAVLSVDN